MEFPFKERIHMDWVAFFGVVGGIFTSIRFIPQVYYSLRSRKTRDLSLTFLLFVSGQSIFLILYGLTKPEYYVLYMNIFPLLCTLLLLVLKIKYR
jgi:MtN3 and saliva related transmembrane protein